VTGRAAVRGAAVDKLFQCAQIVCSKRYEKEVIMKLVLRHSLAATTLALFGLVAAPGFACEYMDSSSASATPPSQLASTPAPAATQVPAVAKVVPVSAPKAAKPEVAKAKAPAPEQKVAAVTSN